MGPLSGRPFRLLASATPLHYVYLTVRPFRPLYHNRRVVLRPPKARRLAPRPDRIWCGAFFANVGGHSEPKNGIGSAIEGVGGRPEGLRGQPNHKLRYMADKIHSKGRCLRPGPNARCPVQPVLGLGKRVQNAVAPQGADLHWRELLTKEGSAPSSTFQFDLVINNVGRLRGRQRQLCKHRDIARGLGVFQGNLC
jgi:hypothetical protein